MNQYVYFLSVIPPDQLNNKKYFKVGVCPEYHADRMSTVMYKNLYILIYI